MSIRTIPQIAATGDVTTGPCVLYGVLNSGAAGTIVLRDGGASGTQIADMDLAAGQYIPLAVGLVVRTSLHATLTTADEVNFMIGG